MSLNVHSNQNLKIIKASPMAVEINEKLFDHPEHYNYEYQAYLNKPFQLQQLTQLVACLMTNGSLSNHSLYKYMAYNFGSLWFDVPYNLVQTTMYPMILIFRICTHICKHPYDISILNKLFRTYIRCEFLKHISKR